VGADANITNSNTVQLDHNNFWKYNSYCWRKAGITKLNVPVVIGEYTPESCFYS
jgi:hypothetical protein